MSWYKQANNKAIFDKIKTILKTNSFIRSLMSDYNISTEDIDQHLDFEIKELDGKFAEGNGLLITLDPKLFAEKDFFKNKFHFVVHEFFHWIKRRSESKFYFNDSEEVQSFVLAIAWEIIAGKGSEEIYKSIYPIVEAHFENKENSQEVFEDMIDKANKLIEVHQSS
jgi:hypothetical protein